MEKTIKMSFIEFEKLNNENVTMRKLLKDRSAIALEYVSESLSSYYTKNTWNIATKDEVIKSLILAIEDLRKEKMEAYKEINSLRYPRNPPKNKTWIEKLLK